MIRSLPVFLAGMLLPVCVAAQTLVQWNFNTPDSDNATGTTSPSTGTGTILAVGGTTAPTTTGFGRGNSNGGSTDPAADADDSGWPVSNFPVQGTADKTAGIEIQVSTLGYNQITVSWDQRHSNSSPANLILQYSTDGGANWIDSDAFAANAGDTWFNSRTKSFAAVTALNNNPNVRFRILAVLSGGAYAGSGGAYATTGNWRFDMVTVTGTPLPLPVSLVSFSGRAVGESVSLEWKTASEKNNSHFVVERAVDARTFESIGTVPGRGTSAVSQLYQYTDRQPEAGVNYYRLRQVDADGTVDYLRVISVETAGAFDPYPNPATDRVQVKGGRVRALMLHSLQGQLLGRSDSREIAIGHLPPGAYLLRTYLETGEFASRLVVKK
ncbi:T9SS type A sorting domain-containing protein [Siphonobacter aquaeclarae]|nr:T9SS type A sorting domain-containing protein [Siphonobacter aquaeclarae]